MVPNTSDSDGFVRERRQPASSVGAFSSDNDVMAMRAPSSTVADVALLRIICNCILRKRPQRKAAQSWHPPTGLKPPTCQEKFQSPAGVAGESRDPPSRMRCGQIQV